MTDDWRLQENVIIKVEKYGIHFLWIFIFRCKFFDTFFLPAASLKSNPRHCLLSKETFQLFFMYCHISFHHFKTHRLIIVSFQKKRFNCFLCIATTHFIIWKLTDLSSSPFKRNVLIVFYALRHLISSFQNSPTYYSYA
jgi:hypothetical protein